MLEMELAVLRPPDGAISGVSIPGILTEPQALKSSESVGVGVGKLEWGFLYVPPSKCEGASS